MKGKKLFASLLSMCVIFSTFVAIPAEAESVYVIDIGSDFDTLPADFKVTTTNSAATVSTPTITTKDGKSVVKIDVSNVSAATANNFLMGFQINDVNGNVVKSFDAGTEFEYKIRFMIESADGTLAATSSSSSGLWVRGGTWDDKGNHPSKDGEVLEKLKTDNGLAANTWIEWEGTFTSTEEYTDLGESSAGQRPYNFYLRPNLNKACTIYIDVMELKVAEKIVDNYDNIITEATAGCEDITEFNQNAYAGSSNVGRALDTTVKHSGESSLKVTVSDAWQALASFVPTDKLIVGEQYYFSVWYYTENNDRICLRYQADDNISNWITNMEDGYKYLTPGEWREYKYTFTVEPGTDFANYVETRLFESFYISTDMTSGTIYFDDFTLRRIPTTVTALTSTAIGEYDKGTNVVMQFTGDIDPESLPKTVKIDNKTVEIEASLVDSTTVSVKFKSDISYGTHILSEFKCKDVWDRDVNVTGNFTYTYSNMIDSANSSCDTLADFETNQYYEAAKVVERSISTDVKRSGTGSVKVIIPGSYATYIGFKPTESLVAGETYKFTVYYSNPGNISGNMIMRYAKTGNSISGLWITGTSGDSQVKMSKGSDWYEYSFQFTATETLANELLYFYLTTNATSGTLYFDDASLKRMSYASENPVEVTANIYPDSTSSETISGWQSGKLVAKATIKNKTNTEQAYNCVIIFANYKGNELVNYTVTTFDDTLDAKESQEVPLELTVSTGDNLQIFVWDPESIIPLTKNDIKK